MSRLIQSLLASSDPVLARTVTVHVHLDPEEEALQVYETAAAEMGQRQRGLTQEYKITVEQLNRQIAVQVTAELAKVDLLNPLQYQAIQSATQYWQPNPESDQASQCLNVRQVLLEMLPLARQKQQLQQPLQEYQAHLKTEIESELASSHPIAYQEYCSDRMGVEIVKAQSQPKPVKARDLDYFLKNEAQILPIKNESLQQAMAKYATVCIAQETLHSAKPATEQVRDFQAVLPQVKSVVEKSRDSFGMKCLKVVATILSLGVAALVGIWNVKGRGTVKKIENTLSPPTVTR